MYVLDNSLNNLNLFRTLIEYDKLTTEETELFNLPRSTDKIKNTIAFNALTTAFLELLPNSGLNKDNCVLTFMESGSAIIREIFNKEVDRDTLIITSEFEHITVKNCVKPYDKKYIFTKKQVIDLDFSELENLLVTYKKVFVYFIGTQLSNGKVTPQSFFIKLIKLFVEKGISYKIALDDVHGMFFVERDYSIFDYVIYTAHAIINNYNMGFLLSRQGEIGEQIYNWGIDYIKRLYILLEKEEKLKLFKTTFTKYFSNLSDMRYFRCGISEVNHIFSIHTHGLFFTVDERQLLKKFYIATARESTYENFIRFRFQEFIKLSFEELLEGLTLLDKILKKHIMIAKLKGDI